MINNEKGYSLVIVLLMITLMSILFIALMGLTINSQKMVTKTEESVVNKVEAENTINEALVYINKEVKRVNDVIKNTHAYDVPSILDRELRSIITNVQAKGYNINYSYLKEGNQYVINAEIIATEGNKKLRKTIRLSTIAEIFNYAVSSGGSLTLNGSTRLEGNIYVNGDVLTIPYGKYLSGDSPVYVNSTYPEINGNLTVKGRYRYGIMEQYKEWQWWPPGYVTRTRLNDSNIFLPSNTTLRAYFFQNPSNPRTPIIKDTEMESQDDLFNENFTGKSSKPALYAEKHTNLNVKNNKTVNGNLIVENDLIIEESGNLTVNGKIYVGDDAILSGKLTIKGDGNYIFIENKNNDKINIPRVDSDGNVIRDARGNISYEEGSFISNLTLTGAVYVNGTLSIRNNLNTNSTIYVKDDIRVSNLSNDDVDDGTLILIGNGDIQVANNNVNHTIPKVMDAFFYTNKQLEIFGIGSNLEIHGGVYGNPVILNAVRGNTTRDRFGNMVIDSDQLNTKSRLSIIHKGGIIKNPPTGIPTINNIQLTEIGTDLE